MYATSPVMIEIIFFAFINSDLSVFYLYLFNHFGRYTPNYRIGFYILRHHSTCSYYGSISDSHSSQHRSIGSNPDILANMDGSIRHTLTLSWVKVVVDGCQHDIVSDECALVDGDAALILELTAHVDEDPFTNDGVLTAVGMKRRKHT